MLNILVLGKAVTGVLHSSDNEKHQKIDWYQETIHQTTIRGSVAWIIWGLATFVTRHSCSATRVEDRIWNNGKKNRFMNIEHRILSHPCLSDPDDSFSLFSFDFPTQLRSQHDQ